MKQVLEHFPVFQLAGNKRDSLKLGFPKARVLKPLALYMHMEVMCLGRRFSGGGREGKMGVLAFFVG